MAEVEESERNEARFESKLAKVDIQTGKGGENSRISKRTKTVCLPWPIPTRLSMGVIDGAGGSGNGELASKVGSAVLSRRFRRAWNWMTRCWKPTRPFAGKPRAVMWAWSCAWTAMAGKSGCSRLCGRCQAMTLHEGKKFAPGTTRFQNLAQRFDIGDIRPEEYYNHPNLNLNKRKTTRREKNPTLILPLDQATL